MSVRCALLALSFSTALLTPACGPPPGMPPSPVNPPVRPPPPQTSAFDGEVIGADRQAPSDLIAQTAQVVVRPGDEQPVRLELAPGWSADRAGIAYSRERQQQLVRGASTPGSINAESSNAGPTNTGSSELEEGEPVFPAGTVRPRPARSPIGSE